MSIEKKAHEAYAENRELKSKYHIPESCWIDWFRKGYEKAVEDQPKIKPLEWIENEFAYTSISEYQVYRDDEDHLVHVFIDGTHEGVYNDYEDAFKQCNEHYLSLIKLCFEQNEAE